MSAAVNSYSIPPSQPSSVPPMPISSASAGSDDRRRIAFDDFLLLPSLPLHYSNSQSYSCCSTQMPTMFPTEHTLANDVLPKYNTAPASPHHHCYAVTPKNSPSFCKAQLATPVTATRRGQETALPSLSHLPLLPDPRLQEHAYMYPDTSEFTPWWKRNLMHWCRATNFHQYTKIANEVSHDRTQLSALLRGANSPPPEIVPSVLEPSDTFKGLSNSASAPMTPPMSPNNVNDVQTTATAQPIEFTPFVSEKLVQTVKQDLYSPTQRHKKTNSFKAMQLKRLLDNRDVLSFNSRPKCDKFKVAKPPSSPPQLPTPSRSNKSIGSAARELALKMDTRNSLSPTRADNAASRASSTKSRSGSASPVHPTTPPHATLSSKYHRFSLDSPQSPVVTSAKKSSFQSISAKSSPTRRPSTSGQVSRKCVSCHSSDSPCWRPSWSGRKQDQLCNSCGLRYKKTHTRCLNETCRKIPTKGELSIMKTNGISREEKVNGNISEGYRCLFCNCITETVGLSITSSRHT